MVLAKYKNIIDEIEANKIKEKNPERKKGWADFELNIRMLDRTIEIQDRIKFLYINSRFIECLCFLSQWIEVKLKEFIKLYIDLSLLVEEKAKVKKGWEKQPLGGLIDIIRECLNNDDLFNRLEEFNELRKKSIHKIFDTNYQIAEVEQEISEYMEYNDYHENIIYPIQRYSIIITQAIFNHNATLNPITKETEIVFSNIIKKIWEVDPSFNSEELKKHIKIKHINGQ